MTLLRFGGALAAAFLLSLPALAQTPTQHHGAHAAPKAGIAVEQPWSRATPVGARVGGGYLRIVNRGPAPDRLVGGSFALAGRVEVHEMRLEADVMRMQPVEGGLEVGPGATVELKPGAYHLMFMDLKEPLKEGATVKGTLVFEKAGPIEVDYAIRAMGGQGPAGHRH